MNPFDRSRKLTARCRIAAILTEEILNRSDLQDFPIASEYQLCRRFGVSRVTIRLAFADLEHRRLIYRRQGKGTFAHARSSRVYPNLGIWMKSPDALKCAGLVDFIRGAQTVMTPLSASLVLIEISPMDWRAELTSTLGAVVILQGDLTADEVDCLNNRKLPFISIPNAQPLIGDKDFFHLGQCAAKALGQAAIMGEMNVTQLWPDLF